MDREKQERVQLLREQIAELEAAKARVDKAETDVRTALFGLAREQDRIDRGGPLRPLREVFAPLDAVEKELTEAREALAWLLPVK